MQRRWSQALSSGALGQDQSQQAQREAQEAPSEHLEHHLCAVRVTALAQIAQAACAASMHGDIPKLLAHSPGQPALGGPN